MLPAQHILAFVIVVAYPLWDWFDTRTLRSGVVPSAKLAYYRKTLAFEWIAAIAAFALLGPQILWIRSPLLRIAPAHPAANLAAGWILAAGLAFVVLSSPARALRDDKVLRIFQRQYARLSYFTPHTPEEFRWFAAVSVTAGICEETIFRGFLIRYFGVAPWHWGLLAAVVISSLAFGAAHLYLGRHALSALLGGFIFALLFLLTGSLFLAMAVHAAADLLAIPILRRAPAARA